MSKNYFLGLIIPDSEGIETFDTDASIWTETDDTIQYDSSAPTAGTWVIGDIVFSETPLIPWQG